MGKNHQPDYKDRDYGSTDSLEDNGSPTSVSRTCQHIKKSVDSLRLRKLLNNSGLLAECNQCQKFLSNNSANDFEVADSPGGFEYDNTLWLCLKCGTQLCGRSRNRHALLHFKTPHSDSHALTMNTRTFEIWCYECDTEISPDARRNLLDCVEFVRTMAQKQAQKMSSVENKILATWETLKPLVTNDDKSMENGSTMGKSMPLILPPPPPIPGMAKRINDASNNCNSNSNTSFSPSAIRLEPVINPLHSNNSNLSNYLSSFDDKTHCHYSIEKLPRVRGLSNLGNTCFFNAVMQCLAQTPYLLDVLKESSAPGEEFTLPGGTFKLNDSEVPLPPIKGSLSAWGALTSALAHTLEELQSGGGLFKPDKLFQKLCSKCPQFQGGDQHDSHELLRHLLESVRSEDLKRYQRVILQNLGYKDQDINTVSDDMKQKCKTYGNQAADRILRPDQVFRGFLVSTLTCQECFNVSSRHEYFLDLSLPVSVEKTPPPQLRRKPSPENVNSFYLHTVPPTSPYSSSNCSMTSSVTATATVFTTATSSTSTTPSATSVGGSGKLVAVVPANNCHNSNSNSNSNNCDNSNNNSNNNNNSGSSSNADGGNILSTKALSKKEKKERRVRIVTKRHQSNNCRSSRSNFDNTGAGLAGDASSSTSSNATINTPLNATESGSHEEDGLISAISSASSSSVEQSDADIEDNLIEEGSEQAFNSNQSNSNHLAVLRNTSNDGSNSNSSSNSNNSSSSNNNNRRNCDSNGNDKNSASSEVERRRLVTPAPPPPPPASQQQQQQLFSPVEKRDDSPENIDKDSLDEDENDSGIATSPANAVTSLPASNSSNSNSETNVGAGAGTGTDTGGNATGADDSTETPTVSNSVLSLGLSERGVNLVKQMNERSINSKLSTDYLMNGGGAVGAETRMSGGGNVDVVTQAAAQLLDQLQVSNEEQQQQQQQQQKKCASATTGAGAGSGAAAASSSSSRSKMKRVRTQSYSDWSTTIAPRYQCEDGECSIQSCLNNFTAVELMTGNNKVGCENCTKRLNGDDPKAKTVNTNATKQFLISSPPAVLILHLKRFQLGPRCMFRKLTRPVNFPMILDIAPFCGSKVKTLPNIDRKQKKLLYALYGVVEHSGGMYGGHYTAYVKVRPQLAADDERWKFIPQGSKAELDQDDEQRKKLEELLAREKARDMRMKAANDSDDFSNSCSSSTDSTNTTISTSDHEDEPRPSPSHPMTNAGASSSSSSTCSHQQQHQHQHQHQHHVFDGEAAAGGYDEASSVQIPLGKWYHVSDSFVQEVDANSVLSAQAYLLFYERIY